MGATEVGGVPIPPEGRVWRHPSEVGQTRRLIRRRRRAMLVAAAWAALLVAAVTIGYGAMTD